MDDRDSSTADLFAASTLHRMNERDASATATPPRPPARPPFLTDAHRAHLRTSGLSDETIAACRFESVSGDAESGWRVARLLRWKGPPPEKAPLGSGILIPYLTPDGAEPVCWAFRPDVERPMKGRKKPAKYLRTTFGKGKGSPPYLPANGHAALADQNAPLAIGEGEKTVAALAQLGYRVIGLAGVDNAHAKDDARWVLREDIAIHARFADVVIAFDADAYTKPGVMLAAAKLAGMLAKAGAASVRFATPPAGGPKGFDDLLAASGEAAVRAAIDGARPIEAASTEKHAKTWEERLARSPGKERRIVPSVGNAAIILAGHPTLAGTFAFNERSVEVVYRKPAPWGGSRGAPVPETDLVRIAIYLGEIGDVAISFTPATLAEALAEVARRDSFDPVRVYLDGLHWDGTKRLDRWIFDFGGAVADGNAKRTAYYEAAGARWMMSAVARTYEPGCKADHMLVLEGEQGKGKSSVLAALVPDRAWFADNLPDLRDKDARLTIHGPLIVEWSELAALRRADLETIKSFITTQADRVRAPYARTHALYPRRCVFAGTVNDDGAGWLADPTGARRFWPVAVEKPDPVRLAAARDQLWAEAVHRYRAHERWWPEGEKDPINAHIGNEHEARYAGDPWEARLADRLGDVAEIHATAAIDLVLGDRANQATRGDAMRAAAAMKRLGFVKERSGSGDRSYVYKKHPKPEPEPAPKATP